MSGLSLALGTMASLDNTSGESEFELNTYTSQPEDRNPLVGLRYFLITVIEPSAIGLCKHA